MRRRKQGGKSIQWTIGGNTGENDTIHVALLSLRSMLWFPASPLGQQPLGRLAGPGKQ